jgi:hypothetical protein
MAGKFDECQELRAGALAREDSRATLALAGDDKESVSGQIDLGQDPSPSDTAADFSNSAYKSAYTPFQFYPRFVIWDRTPRLGLAVSSFEILDKQALFFGGTYGTNKEFDGFVSYEIRNFWPTLFAEGIYVREIASDRAVDDDPFSSSFEHAFAFNLRYDLWMADLGMKLEFAETNSPAYQHDVSLSWSHAEYSVNIDGQEFDETGQYLTSFDGGWKYYIGNQVNLRYGFRRLLRAIDTDINPRGGRHILLWYMRAFDDLFENGEFEYGFRPIFTDNNYNQYTVDWREYVGLPWWRHSLRLRLYGAVIDNDVDSFFWFYLGGRDGIRGYNYYSIGGRKGVMGSITYRFPILRNIGQQFLNMYFRDFYGSVFYETASAWKGLEDQTSDGFKDSMGYELRFSMGSYYIFPTAVSIVGAYAFDNTSFVDPGFGVPTRILQGKGWTYYVTIGFGFDL